MTPPIPEPRRQLTAIIEASPWMMEVLTTVRHSGLPDAWVGAGALRDLVWGQLYGHGFNPAGVHDVDVAFWDPARLDWERNDEATAELTRFAPGLPWEARNQAAVHTWFHHRFGGNPATPFTSIAEAVASWPETATAVAARLQHVGTVELCAPHGVDDLLAGTWRRNPTRVTLSESRARLARHQPQQRWPGVQVIPPT
ncbi:nucleotidyltransferase family protein [Actinoplanes sp. NBRC 103695]|uniref:nucleotidyltransferase family protein n=1 Tax=Actinoplanes sp. NBRC 103695 TaxID=3032202 RepID=UPI0024A25BB5|nr:nucleotidyltransferase family protein [Actinoplanes sp. NBRC 103695]GLY99825.1 hypothetical protein Acsp02_70780 [Actinoplanes sp. NBRC 103695]